jgi:hypothetical protein
LYVIILLSDTNLTLLLSTIQWFHYYFRVKVYQSNTAKHNLKPVWNEAQLDIEAVCNGDLGRAMKIIIWDYRRGGKHRHMGEFETTIQGLLTAKELADKGEELNFTVLKHDKSAGTCAVLEAVIEGGTNGQQAHIPRAPKETAPLAVVPGPAIPSNIQVQERPEFIDYLTGGCQISLAVAIDFTASNGDPRQEGTPHYFHPPASKEWNDYEKAIFAVGSILAKYDADQKFPVWGFGAKVCTMYD